MYSINVKFNKAEKTENFKLKKDQCYLFSRLLHRVNDVCVTVLTTHVGMRQQSTVHSETNKQMQPSR